MMFVPLLQFVGNKLQQLFLWNASQLNIAYWNNVKVSSIQE